MERAGKFVSKTWKNVTSLVKFCSFLFKRRDDSCGKTQIVKNIDMKNRLVRFHSSNKIVRVVQTKEVTLLQ